QLSRTEKRNEMYLNFYNFKKEPFHITPDPDFLFLSKSHKEALGSIIYGIEKRKGFVAITGAVGVGKTTILRSYLEKADKEKIKSIYIFNPSVSFKSLLKTIHQELEIETRTDDVHEMVDQLHRSLIEEFKNGHNVVLVIDEAQNIPIATLENLRMLSNLETSKEKLIQMVLIGQPEFEQMLKKHSLRQINQRIAIRSVILPLTPKESSAYIHHRLAKVTSDGERVFTRSAVRKIVKAAHGVPRTLNILCDNALITGYGSQKKPVTARMVREVLSDISGGKKTSILKWRYASVPLFAMAAAVFWFSLYEEPMKKEQPPPGPQKMLPSIQNLPSAAEKLPEFPQPKVPERQKQYPVMRAVKKGDNLSTLIQDVYGFSDPKIIDWIKSKNPSIKNVHKIYIGNEILFPELDSMSKKRTQADTKQR
ncbi:MAG: AAA family ATPase, partial [Syntrophales bacterium]